MKIRAKYIIYLAFIVYRLLLFVGVFLLFFNKKYTGARKFSFQGQGSGQADNAAANDEEIAVERLMNAHSIILISL